MDWNGTRKEAERPNEAVPVAQARLSLGARVVGLKNLVFFGPDLFSYR